MITAEQLYASIKAAERAGSAEEKRPFRIVALADQPQPGPPHPLRVAFNAYLSGLNEEAIRDLYCLMYAGRGDGSFMDLYRESAGRSASDMLLSIEGKAASVVAGYWRAAIKQPIEFGDP